MAATALSAQAIRAMRDPRALASLITPAFREQMRAALDTEYALAAAMTDDVFWGYDQAWLTLGAPAFVNMSRPGQGGGGGQNMSWNNNQFWSLAQACDRGLFTLVMFQQRRYIAAQIRLRAHLERVPQWQVADGLDVLAQEGGDVRRACGGVQPKTMAREWAEWCQHALALIGVARWASNFTWSDSSKTCGDIIYRLDAQPITLAYDTGCRYSPDCSSDIYGVPRLGYVAGQADNGIRRWEAAADVVRHPKVTPTLVAAATAGWQIRWDERRERAALRSGTGVPFSFSDLPFSIAPRALGLHASSRTPGAMPQIPQSVEGFHAAWASNAFADYPPFLEKPAGWNSNATTGDWLYAYFLEHPTGLPGFAEQVAQREKTGCWYWKYAPIDTGGGASGLATNQAHPVPASEWLIWNIIAKARDIVAMSFGDMIIQGFANLERAVLGIPIEFRGSLEGSVATIRSAATALRAQDGATVGGAFASVAAAAAAINPIAGIVVGVIGALVSALVTFSIEIGLARGSNPPALQAPAMRVAPPTAQGDDRCWINPGEIEALEAYRARVATPYAEAAVRSGGDPGRLFDIVPQVRGEQYCRANPQDPACQQQAAGFPWKKWLAGAGGTAAGVALIKIIGG